MKAEIKLELDFSAGNTDSGEYFEWFEQNFDADDERAAAQFQAFVIAEVANAMRNESSVIARQEKQASGGGGFRPSKELDTLERMAMRAVSRALRAAADGAMEHYEVETSAANADRWVGCAEGDEPSHGSF